jgi:hypothetical protein
VPWTAHTQVDLARVLRTRGQRGDAKRADRLEHDALATAQALGMPALLATITSTGLEDVPQEPAVTASGRFRREGEYWTVTWDGSTVRVRDAKGMRYLAMLLAHPGREFHALDLVGNGVAAPGPVRARDETGMTVRDIGDAGVRLDAEAKSAYLERLRELRLEAAEAEEWNDPERSARAHAEIGFLTDELKGAVGLGGRDRPEASASERARLSVTRAVRSAITRIAEQQPTLGSHLSATVRTGTFCSYQPDPRLSTTWEI